MKPLTAAILLTLSLATAIVLLVFGPATATPATPPAAEQASGASDTASAEAPAAPTPAPDVAPATSATSYVAPSTGAAAFRLFGGVVAVGLVMAASLYAYRWLVRRRLGAGSAAQERRYRPQVVSRTYLGAKESLCVVEVGHERFLIAATPTGISLLGRLERGESPAPVTEEPSASDFGRVLQTATSTMTTLPPADESALRAALARSRERLARLGHVSSVGEPRA